MIRLMKIIALFLASIFSACDNTFETLEIKTASNVEIELESNFSNINEQLPYIDKKNSSDADLLSITNLKAENDDLNGINLLKVTLDRSAEVDYYQIAICLENRPEICEQQKKYPVSFNTSEYSTALDDLGLYYIYVRPCLLPQHSLTSKTCADWESVRYKHQNNLDEQTLSLFQEKEELDELIYIQADGIRDELISYLSQFDLASLESKFENDLDFQNLITSIVSYVNLGQSINTELLKSDYFLEFLYDTITLIETQESLKLYSESKNTDINETGMILAALGIGSTLFLDQPEVETKISTTSLSLAGNGKDPEKDNNPQQRKIATLVSNIEQIRSQVAESNRQIAKIGSEIESRKITITESEASLKKYKDIYIEMERIKKIESVSGQLKQANPGLEREKVMKVIKQKNNFHSELLGAVLKREKRLNPNGDFTELEGRIADHEISSKNISEGLEKESLKNKIEGLRKNISDLEVDIANNRQKIETDELTFKNQKTELKNKVRSGSTSVSVILVTVAVALLANEYSLVESPIKLPKISSFIKESLLINEKRLKIQDEILEKSVSLSE